MYLTIDANYHSLSFCRQKWWKNISKKRFLYSKGTYKDTRQVFGNQAENSKNTIQKNRTLAEKK